MDHYGRKIIRIVIHRDLQMFCDATHYGRHYGRECPTVDAAIYFNGRSSAVSAFYLGEGETQTT